MTDDQYELRTVSVAIGLLLQGIIWLGDELELFRKWQKNNIPLTSRKLTGTREGTGGISERFNKFTQASSSERIPMLYIFPSILIIIHFLSHPVCQKRVLGEGFFFFVYNCC